MELFEKFGIDIKILLANIVTFFIFVFILWKILYKPILTVLDKRRKKIEKSMEQAKEIEERLAKIDLKIKKDFKKAHQESELILEKSKQEAEEERAKMKLKAKAEIEELKTATMNELKQEKMLILETARKEMVDLIVMLSKKVIHKNLTKEDELNLDKDLIKVIEAKK